MITRVCGRIRNRKERTARGESPSLLRVPTYLAALAAVPMAMPCAAHHSFASFDMTRTLTLHGTVRELQWTNPHCFVQLLVPGKARTVEWSLEMNSPLASYRAGWRPHTVNPGDKVTIVINPSRDGTPAGHLVSVTDAGGHTLGVPARARPSTPPRGPAS